MKKSTIVAIMAVLVLFSTAMTKEKVNFSGDWVLDKQLSKLPEGRIQISKLSITQDGDKISVKRTYANDEGEEYPFVEELTLGGDTLQHDVYDMPRKAAARWSEDKKHIVFESTTTFSGDYGEVNLVAMENWSLDSKAETFTVEYTTSMPQGEQKGTAVFKKAAPKTP